MIHRLPITTARDTPVNKNHPSTPQIVTCKDPIPYSSPHKEGNMPRSLNLPNTFPREDNGQGVSQLIVKRADIKSPISLSTSIAYNHHSQWEEDLHPKCGEIHPQHPFPNHLVFRSFGIFWVLPRSVADTLFGRWNWPGKHVSSIWNIAPLCLMWCLWRERNMRTFEDMESSDDQLLASFSGSLFDWFRAWGLTSSDSLPLFLSSLLYN